MVLPLENLPERSAPTRKDHTAHFLDIGIETQEKLDGCDWNLYERTIEAGLIEATKRYKSASAGPDAVFQISVVTDPQRQITEIAFETKPHAQAKVRELAEWFRTRNEHHLAEKLETAGLNPNPTDFRHPNYYTILHRELRPLDRIDYSDEENKRAAKVWIETSLLKVMDRIRSFDLLAVLPREEEVWIGVNSPRDWYDHVVVAQFSLSLLGCCQVG